MGKLLSITTIAFLLSLFSVSASAQQYSLKDSVVVDSLMQLSMQTYYSSPVGALPYAQKALYITEKINYTNGIWQCYNALSIIHRTIGNIDSGFYYSNKNIDFLFSRKTQADSAGAYLEKVNLAGVYIKQGEILNALQTCKISMEYFDAIRDTHGMMSVRGRLSNIYTIIEDYPTARKYSQEQLNLIRNLKFKQARTRTGSAYRDIGETYAKEKEYEKALLYYDSAHAVFMELKDSLDIVINNITVTETYLAMGDLDRAFPLIKQSLKFSEERGALNQSVFALHQMHLYYRDKGRADSAKYYGEKCLEAAAIAKNLVISEGLYYQLALIYEQIGDKDKAIEYLKKHKVLSDSLKQESVYRALQAQNFDDELKQAELERVKILAENADKNRTITNLGLIGGLSLSAAIIMLILGVNLRKNRRELSAANANLAKNNDVKNRLLAIISHDIRSPLASLHGVIKLSKKNILTTEETQELIGKLEDKFNITLDLVDNLLYWTKNQINAIEPTFISFSIDGLIDNTIKSIESTAAEKKITINSTFAEDNSVYADRNMIDIAIRNLLSNAVKFTDSGGTINIITTRNNHKLKVEIKDNGVGMSDEKKASLFTANNTSSLGTAKEKGTGLGLLVSYDFIKTNNSELFVESSLDVGTTFYFELQNKN